MEQIYHLIFQLKKTWKIVDNDFFFISANFNRLVVLLYAEFFFFVSEFDSPYLNIFKKLKYHRLNSQTGLSWNTELYQVIFSCLVTLDAILLLYKK